MKKTFILLCVATVISLVFVGYTLTTQHNESVANDGRFCEITHTFINSNITLRGAQNVSSVDTILAREKTISEIKALLKFFPKHPKPAVVIFRRLFLAEIAERRAANKAAARAVVAASSAEDLWDKLKKQLKCE